MAAALHFPLSVSLSPPTLLLLRLLLQQQQQQSAPQPPKLTWLLTSFAGRLSVVSMAVVFAWLEITAQIVWLYSLISTALSSLFILVCSFSLSKHCLVRSGPVSLSVCLSVCQSDSMSVCEKVRRRWLLLLLSLPPTGLPPTISLTSLAPFFVFRSRRRLSLVRPLSSPVL